MNMYKLLGRLSAYLRQNPGVPFVLGFELLLVVAALYLIGGDVNDANAIGVFAFILLVIGVAMLAISVIKGSTKAKPAP